MPLVQTLIITAVITVILMAAIWPVSLKLRDASVVDVYWGPGFAVIAWIVYALGDTHPTRGLVLAMLITLWSARLGFLMIQRHTTKTAEDPRYAAMRERGGERFANNSLVTVFLFQALLMWLISLPIQVGQFGPETPTNFFIATIGTAIFLGGLIIETLADIQLAQFKAEPSNKGRILETGLWAWSRHPNYFGEILVWWGLYVVALSSSMGWWTIVSPLLLTFLIARVSGVPMLEAGMRNTKMGYDAYAQRTSALIPRPPQREDT